MSVKAVPAESAVTASDIAAMLDVSLETVYRTATTASPKAGEIPGFKVGRSWRFFPSVVKAHLTNPRDRWAQPVRSRARKRAAA